MNAQQPVTTVPAHGPARPVGLLSVEGKDAASFLNGYTTQEVATLAPGNVRFGAITDWKGQVTDVVTFVGLAKAILLVGTPGRIGAVHKGLQRYLLGVDVRLSAVSGWLALDVPGAPEAWPGVTDGAAAVAACLGTGPVQGGGAILIGPAHPGPAARLLLPAGEQVAWGAALATAGWSTLDDAAVLRQRIASGWPEPDRDLPVACNPWEARLAPFVRMDKGCYLGQEVVARLINYKRVQRWLMGTRAAAAVPEGVPLLADDVEVGRMGSSVPDGAGGWLGLALVGAAMAEAGVVLRTAEGVTLTLEDRPLWAGAASAAT
jgi:folate-binding protein YgfZ